MFCWYLDGSEVADMLANKGYKPECGARELRRVVERELEMRMAEIILNYENRSHTLSAQMKNDCLVLAWR
jgi:ATP-dependent Clp protease ATP-binding subunit ClpA